MTAAQPDWLGSGLGHLWLPYTQMKTAPPPLPVKRTEGCRLYLDDGRVLIDGIASWWTACHGYNHPHIAAAVSHQLAEMPHVMFAGLVHEPAARLATRLAALLPDDLDRVFFSESGSVAVEIALKIARQYWRNRGEERGKFVAFRDGYHGDTAAAMAVSDPASGMHGRGRDLLLDQLVVDLPRDEASTARLDALLAREAATVAAIVIEPLVQAAGGMIFHDAETLRRVRGVADRYGILLIADEIFTGFHRTGALFACEAAGVLPDIVTLSKALTGGVLPLAATVARRTVFEAFLSDDAEAALMHGPTFMANALACSAANASLDLFAREDHAARVAAIEASLMRDLAPCRKFAGVRDVRVKGAIGAIELDRIHDHAELRRRFLDEGVWIRPFGNIVYLTPAFTIGADDLAKLTGAIGRVLGG
ncbi:MAG TPA: adenosylmethionine--8-amino-7-oxononanoate transaminase [Stellaceae bacterium]|jgi:adenosylmethionine-8-amino-7-oxononanoate aminotransferase|nr:adenosylmethionine--8-amino-7-oxononanoate transaminase [Stellaceae bacterium]